MPAAATTSSPSARRSDPARSIAGGSGADTLSLYGTTDLAVLALSGIEILHVSGYTAKAKASDFEAFDTIRYNSANPATQLSLTIIDSGTATTRELSDELFAGGGPRSVLLTGSTDSETITVGMLGDTVNAGAGADTVSGGLGSDTLNGEAGADTLYCEDGNDTLNGGANDGTLIGGDGDDTIDGGTENDVLYGDAGDDIITDTGGTVASITGGTGDDTLRIGRSFTSGSVDGGTGIDERELWSGSQDLSISHHPGHRAP